jgi:hypothetical protein
MLLLVWQKEVLKELLEEVGEPGDLELRVLEIQSIMVVMVVMVLQRPGVVEEAVQEILLMVAVVEAVV